MNTEFLQSLVIRLSENTDVITMLIGNASADISSFENIGVLSVLLRDVDNTIFDIETVLQKEYNSKENLENTEK